jgi:hypothetical protein
LYNRPEVAAVPSGLSLTPLTIIIIIIIIIISPLVTKEPFYGVQRLKCEAKHSPLYSAEVKGRAALLPLPLHLLMKWWLGTETTNFVFHATKQKFVLLTSKALREDNLG